MISKAPRPAAGKAAHGAGSDFLGRNDPKVIDFRRRRQTRPKGQDEVTRIIEIDCIIGRTRVAFRTTSYLHDRSIWHWGFCKNGKGRRCRVYGVHRDRRVTIKRYTDPEAAARVYHARCLALGLHLVPIRYHHRERTLVIMGSALLTKAGANSGWGQSAAAQMKMRGLRVLKKPFRAEESREFWFADNAGPHTPSVEGCRQ